MKSMAMVAAVIALLATGLLAQPVDAATMGTARIGSSYGEARILVGTSTRLSIAAKNLRARTAYTVSLRRGNCSSVGALVVSRRMTTSSYGKITTSFALTTSQARLVKLPISIRVGTRCGSFKAPVVPTPTPNSVFAGRFEAVPGVSAGNISFVISEAGEIAEVTLGEFNVTNFDCGGGKTISITGFTKTMSYTAGYGIAITGGRFSISSANLDWDGVFDSATSVRGKIRLSFSSPTSPCQNRPLSATWSAKKEGSVVPPPPLELRSAVAAGKVVVSGRGINLQRLEITLASQVAQPLELVIEPATVFRPGAAATQPMTTLAAQVVTLAPMESKTLTLDVACASMHLDQPSSSDQFGLDTTPSSTALLALLKVPDFAGQTFRVRQFAIWTITDNPTRTGYVGLGSFGIGSGPSDEEIAVIKQLFVKAGLDPSGYLALA